MFKDKILLITGGTGSFGNAVLDRFLDTHIKEIRVFSRDEKKQDEMRHRLNSPKVKFYIGDVRDRRSVDNAIQGVDYVFHAAALKQVPSCEFFPIEAMEETSVIMTGLNTERILQGLSVIEKQENLKEVKDYMISNVSDKILRIILSYTDYIKRDYA